MSNFLLYKPGINDGSQNELPNVGMGVVAAEAVKAGHRVFTVDNHFHQVPTVSPPFNTDAILYSLVSQEWDVVKEKVVAAVKEHIPVVIGGPHAFSYHDTIQGSGDLRVVTGEVDGRWDAVDTATTPTTHLGHSPTLTTPDFSSFVGIDTMRAYPLYTSRGCTGSACSFCVAGKAHGKFRVRSLDDVFGELDMVGRVYPRVEKVYVVDDCFTGDMVHAQFFLSNFLMKGYNTKYRLQIINVRADQLNRAVLDQMYAAGVRMLPIGVESGCSEVYSHVGKGETLDQIRYGIELIQKARITPWLNMIIGLPHDTYQHHLKSLEWCLSIPKPRIIHWFVFSPFRRTRAFDYLKKRGVIPDNFIPRAYGRRYDELPWRSDFGTDDFTVDERQAAQLEAYLRCHSPILINNIERVEQLCVEYGLKDALDDWWKHAPISEYRDKELQDKRLKGQVR